MRCHFTSTTRSNSDLSIPRSGSEGRCRFGRAPLAAWHSSVKIPTSVPVPAFFGNLFFRSGFAKLLPSCPCGLCPCGLCPCGCFVLAAALSLRLPSPHGSALLAGAQSSWTPYPCGLSIPAATESSRLPRPCGCLVLAASSSSRLIRSHDFLVLKDSTSD
jgi:hypothetical protein